MHTPPASRSKPTPTHELPFGATLRKLLLIIPASFALPVIVLLLIASYLSNTVGPNPDSSPMSTRAIARRIAPVAQLVVASGPRMAEKWNAASLSAAAPTPNAQAKTPATAHAPVGGTSASAMLTLARRKNCLTCHAADHKVVGPAYEAVAEKYAGKPGAEQMLVNAVLQATSAPGARCRCRPNRVPTRSSCPRHILTFLCPTP